MSEAAVIPSASYEKQVLTTKGNITIRSPLPIEVFDASGVPAELDTYSPSSCYGFEVIGALVPAYALLFAVEKPALINGTPDLSYLNDVTVIRPDSTVCRIASFATWKTPEGKTWLEVENQNYQGIAIMAADNPASQENTRLGNLTRVSVPLDDYIYTNKSILMLVTPI